MRTREGSGAWATRGARLPAPRGPLSDWLVDVLAERTTAGPPDAALRAPEPFGADLQLALYTCYELHYRSFAGVPAEREWDLGVLAFRAALERTFLAALRDAVPGVADPQEALAQLLVDPVDGGGVAGRLQETGLRWQMREYLVHRSLYHLKEADPHAWVIPRLTGSIKAALVAVEYDEFGGGRGERVHQQLFADLMAGLDLDPRYLHYLDAVPAPMLAVVNLMSLLGLHRALRGGLVGHFAAAEISTPPSAKRMVEALRRMDAPAQCIEYYTEHIEADAVHEQVMRHDVLAALCRAEPELVPDVVLGIEATVLVEDRLAAHLLHAWDHDSSSLLLPLPDAPNGPRE
ncbi:hypothetical protein NUM_30720 [Actinocatenispora comari]|uniref:Iron-containing redox enzyme family protein n=2 Tax=Actinocatenispora comari TaxID=2807577 RepID=A0A8J4ELI0_9ACTN|nr:hypothetical protein NUM_30720 [Actinocatenispora comari]